MKKSIIIIAIVITILCLNKEEKVIIPKESIRFRVIANSNTKQDQDLKRKIISNLNRNISKLEYKNKDLSTSRNNIQKSINEFSNLVEKTLKEEKSTYTYAINYGTNYFPKKEYKGVVYEEGEYESLVITLGEGKGKNFWCVLFPPLCLLDEEEEPKNIQYTSLVKEIIDKYF